MNKVHKMHSNRKIVHIDMDAFYAAVETLDTPSLKGLPVVVGGNPESRSVVCSASYEARKFGVKSAMACSVAKRLCPDAIFVRPNMIRYKEISSRIHSIFNQFTNIIEAVSLDEAWLDVTENIQKIPSAIWVAEKIKKQIKQELDLTCSAGVSFNKFLSKIASDENKPDGLFVITPDSAQEFLNTIQIKKIPGVGKVTEKKMHELNIKFGHQLHNKSINFLVEHFGKTGYHLYHFIRGIDDRPITTNREIKSVSVENTFEKDLLFGKQLIDELKALVAKLMLRLGNKAVTGKTLTLKVKFKNFHQITRSITVANSLYLENEIFTAFYEKLKDVCNLEFKRKGIRLIGIGISNLLKNDEQNKLYKQLDFFDLLR